MYVSILCQDIVLCCDCTSLIMEDASDPREEVKKLQELVRKLEHQNQQLLNHQLLQNRTNNPGKSVNWSEGKKNQILDEVDLINIEDLELSDEDSWLYLSPKGLSPEERAVSAHKWLRKDVEDPHNRELQMARRALMYKLDELAILSPGNHSMQNGRLPFGKKFDFLTTLSIRKNLEGHGVDSRTFTRPKKKREDVMDGIGEQRTSRGKVDFINVQEIARMQEESLRQSSPSSTPKRNSVSSLSSSGRRLSTSSRNSTDSEISQPSESTKPDSSHSSPAESPQGSSNTLNKASAPLPHSIGETFRSSMPNLAKGNCPPVRPTQPRVQSPSRIGMYSANASSSPIRGERRLAAPSRSTTNLRNVSPVRSFQKGSPVQQPRPSTKITRIPSPKTRSLGLAVPSRIARSSNSWNDGCF